MTKKAKVPEGEMKPKVELLCANCGADVEETIVGECRTCWALNPWGNAERLNELLVSANERATSVKAKLTRVLDWLRFNANSGGGIAQEIEDTLRRVAVLESEAK